MRVLLGCRELELCALNTVPLLLTLVNVSTQTAQGPVLHRHAIVRSQHGIANFLILSLGFDSPGGGYRPLHSPAPGWLLALDHYFLRRAGGVDLYRGRGDSRCRVDAPVVQSISPAAEDSRTRVSH